MRESIGVWSYKTPQEIVAKQTKKRPRGPTVNIKDKKKTRPKARVGEGLVGWVGPLYKHDEKIRLMWCSPPSSFLPLAVCCSLPHVLR